MLVGVSGKGRACVIGNCVAKGLCVCKPQLLTNSTVRSKASERSFPGPEILMSKLCKRAAELLKSVSLLNRSK
ncbi:hypothetical protein I7I53_11724 [Histoplasma capsulatum var. duboisii H88]|uniref:Uncharacterized protein n=1 Tax=Ajellomyces capsulatus (strain H88) TaxID=544711 RepID=A0A8A1LY98_AJEC8|nr:hypothetical protein I7I53_11724 [Histoplasma capsulatum var. duboisii H88]